MHSMLAWRTGILLVGLLTAANVLALDPDQATTHYRVSAWGVANGLPHASVSALFQDRDGYLWVGTYQGAARFDGVRFVGLGDLADRAVAADMIESIAQTPDGTLWFGGRYRGITRLDSDGSVRQYRAGSGLEHDSVTLLRAHPDGGLWLGTDVGLFRAVLDGEQLVLSPELPELVWALSQDRSGRWWAGSENGLWRRDRDGWQRGSYDRRLDKVHVWGLAFDAQDRGYAGYRGGVARTAGDGFEVWATHERLPNPVVRAALPDARGSLWLATAGAGLLRLRESGQEALTKANGLPSDVVWEATFDREGNLWAGTAAGLARIGDAQVQTYGEPEGLPSGFAWSVSPRRAGGWWMGFNGGGLAAFDNGRRIEVSGGAVHDQGSAVVQTVLDLGDEQWLGTLDGLFRRDEASGRQTAVPALSGYRVQALVQDQDGSLLVGTQRGLMRVRGDQMQEIALPGAHAASVSRLRADGPGRWLVAAHGAGLFQLEDGKASRLSAVGGMPVRDAVRDADGRIWLAAIGLHVIDDSGLHAIEPINRQLVAQLHALEIDGRGRLWATSNAGVLRVELALLARYLDASAAGFDYALFGEAEGMRSSECNGGTQNALALASDGAVWVATTEGVVRIPGEATTRPAELPSLHIERLVADGTNLIAHDGLELPAGVRQLVIDYTALRLSDAERLRFRYRLLPATSGWSDNQGRRSVVFQGLRPGRHRFEAAVATASEPWSPAVGLDFTIAPLWWQRGDVQVAALLLLLALATAIPLWRVRLLRGRERLLAAEVQARTADLVRANAALARAASDDFLTGLPNRRSFVQALERACASDQELALAILDIDYFKAYNDSAGHLAGDQCLIAFAEVLAACAGAHGVSVGRIGGEEFALLLAGPAATEAGAFLDDLVARMRQRALPHPAPGCGPCVSFSAGLARRLTRSDTPNALLARADDALYRAKSLGRDRWVLAD